MDATWFLSCDLRVMRDAERQDYLWRDGRQCLCASCVYFSLCEDRRSVCQKAFDLDMIGCMGTFRGLQSALKNTMYIVSVSRKPPISTF